MDGCDRYDYLEFTNAKGENMRNKRPDGAMACRDSMMILNSQILR